MKPISSQTVSAAKNFDFHKKPVTLKIYDQMWHVWHLAVRLMPETKTAVNQFGFFIRNHFID